MRFSLAAAIVVLLNTVAVPASPAQDQAQAPTSAPGVDRDAQCAMFMRDIIVQLMMRGNLSRGEQAFLDRYGVLFNYFAGRFSVGHEAASAVPLITSTVRGMSTDIQAKMDCYHGGDGTMKGVSAQIERAVPKGRNGSGAGAASPGLPSPTQGADEDGFCIAAVQRILNERARLSGSEGMRNPAHVVRAVEYYSGRLVARGGWSNIEPVVAASYAVLPPEQAAADTLGFRCVAEATRGIDAFSEAIADAEEAAEK